MKRENLNKVVINSFPRTGNTLLYYFFVKFFEKNNLNNKFETISHTHSYKLLKISNSNSFKQIIIFRNPIDTITSYTIYKLSILFNSNEFLKNNIKIKETTDILIEKFLNDYNIFLNEFLKYNNGIAIKFEYLTENTENCFNDLLNKINLNNYNIPTLDDVLNTIKYLDKKETNNDELLMLYQGHAPRDIKNSDLHKQVKEKIINNNILKESIKLYNSTIERIEK